MLVRLPRFSIYSHGISNIRVGYAGFHASSQWKLDGEDHYKTLNLPHDATPASVKKQFYALSHRHHPDHNPNDPSASERFVKISEAYAVLGNPSKRERYDRETQHTSQSRNAQQGSHSSSSNSTPFGSRPASGLSKRRTQFRGPPPSFYRTGGWGAQGAKRAAGQESTASAFYNPASGSGARNSGAQSDSSPKNSAGSSFDFEEEGGFSGGRTPRSAWNDVPHFDREGHLWTQEQHERRRRRRMEEESVSYDRGGGGMIINFLFVTGVVVLASFMPQLYEKALAKRKAEEKE